MRFYFDWSSHLKIIFNYSYQFCSIKRFVYRRNIECNFFFFNVLVMSLQRIFSSTTIIVGLFISVDYGLCDEFRCRGREVTSHTAVAMRGSWGVRALWTFVYVGGLAAFAMFFTMLERHYTTTVIYYHHIRVLESVSVCNVCRIYNNMFVQFLLEY